MNRVTSREYNLPKNKKIVRVGTVILTLVSSRRVETNAPTRRKTQKMKMPENLAGDCIDGRHIMCLK